MLKWISRGMVLAVTVLLLMVSATSTAEDFSGRQETRLQAHKQPKRYSGKKILLINSYHEGYEWSDGIEAGALDILKGTGVELRFFRMDTKRNDSVEYGKQAGLEAKAVIDAFKPDIVIAADDNAQKYVVVPYLKNTGLPVVFCGVNWDASIYGYPCENITGMIEVDLLPELLEHLVKYAKGSRVGFLAADVEVERKLADFYNENFCGRKMKIYLTKTFDQWKKEFVRAQGEVDVLVNHNNAGLTDWDGNDAEAFVLREVKIPLGSPAPWMARFNLITVAIDPKEQGEYAALTALRILDGTKPSDIPLVTNKRANLILNMNIAHRLGIVFDSALLETAEIIGAPAER